MASTPLDVERGSPKRPGPQKKRKNSKGGLDKPKPCCCIRLWPLWVFLLLLAAGAAVAVKMLWFQMPKIVYERHLSTFDMVENPDGGATISLHLRAEVFNPNMYPLTFSHVSLDVYDFEEGYIGEATRVDAVTARSGTNTTFIMDAQIITTPEQMKDLSQNCLANGKKTTVTAKGTLRGHLVGQLTIPVNIGPYQATVNCLGAKKGAVANAVEEPQP